MSDYQLLDSGHGKKLEQFGPYLLNRPCAQATWAPQQPPDRWAQASAGFDRQDGLNWKHRNRLPESWTVKIDGISFKLSATDFGHLGVFPEQRPLWQWIAQQIQRQSTRQSILNLFAYSGGATLAAARAGAKVCHLDASKGMVTWAKENAALNTLQDAPIRWIVDDVVKFLKREIRRGNRYNGIILDPPSFGRGAHGEVYKIEENLPDTLALCRELLSDQPLFVLLSCHTPSFTPIALSNILSQMCHGLSGHIEPGEMLLTGSPPTLPVPSGTFARWVAS